MAQEIMNREHPLWDELCARLEGPEGCDFHANERDEETWRCKGGRDKSKAITILESIGSIDIPQTLEYFEAHCGHCDCEILFNVDQ